LLREPLKGDQRAELFFRYGGSVMSDAGNGLIYVGPRGTWYPNRGLAMSHYDLTFSCPVEWTLIATGKLISQETVGEFEIRGPWIVDRYYKSGDENNHSNTHWFKTGDVGTIDEDGYMMITDRKKDLIKSGGEWISSIALELALIEHPKVKEACVIAIPDERWTERPLACIVFADNEKTTNADLRSFLETRFATYQVPELFVELKEIPKTSVGKMDKKELRRLYANGQL
jgi:acyl-CoA synthetase (AMP-forming)/AMP-acid ligase II